MIRMCFAACYWPIACEYDSVSQVNLSLFLHVKVLFDLNN